MNVHCLIILRLSDDLYPNNIDRVVVTQKI